MLPSPSVSIIPVLVFAAELVVILRVLLRPHRDPYARIAWIVVILGVPLVGILAYFLLGEVSIGRARAERVRAVQAGLPDMGGIPGVDAPGVEPEVSERYRPLFAVGQAISEFPAMGGNEAELMADSDAAIERMVADIDAANSNVHLLFYIWLPDRNGTKMAEALIRAAGRGVACRALVDDIGSAALTKSALWTALETAGVRLARALPVGRALFHIVSGRIDLRNHRKIVVIDNRISYCGSQNCADPEFLPKARYGPWVDAMMRFEGPIVRQNQYVFAADWMAHVDEDLRDMLVEPMARPGRGFPAQVVATGPTERHSAMPEMFATLIYAARHELVITTPYYVPDASMQSALCAAGRRGVATTIVFPENNDDFAVAATSRSYYEELIDSGVHIWEFSAGLLHTKSLTIDGEVTLIGSANMDRRSFDLNYENNVLIVDKAVTASVRGRQHAYLADSRRVLADEVGAWSWRTRLWNNTLAIVGPVL